MKTLNFSLSVLPLAAAGLLLGNTTVFCQPPVAPAVPATVAEAPAPVETFSFELGRAVVDRGHGANSTYAAVATRDFHAKETGGKLRLSVVEQDAGGTATHLLTINTGKYKTVAQMTTTLAEIFRQYLAAAAANQELGKIGDLSHGGEIHFYAESPEVLRYEWLTPGEPAHVTRFKRNDIQIFLGLLTHPKAAS